MELLDTYYNKYKSNPLAKEFCDNTAINLIKKGYDNPFIQEILGLPIEEIEQLRISVDLCNKILCIPGAPDLDLVSDALPGFIYYNYTRGKLLCFTSDKKWEELQGPVTAWVGLPPIPNIIIKPYVKIREAIINDKLSTINECIEQFRTFGIDVKYEKNEDKVLIILILPRWDEDIEFEQKFYS